MRKPSKNAPCQCGAKPGEPCKTVSGRALPTLHKKRFPAEPAVGELVLVQRRNGYQLARIVSLGQTIMEVRPWADSRDYWEPNAFLPRSRFMDRPVQDDPRIARALAAEKGTTNAHS